MRTVEAWAPSPASYPVPAGPGRPRHWYVVGPVDHPAAAAVPAPPAAGGRAGIGTVVLLGAVFTDADNARLVEGVRAAVRRGGRLVLLHLGAGGASLIRAATSENRALRALSVELAPQPSAAAVRTAAALVTGDLGGPDELRVDQDGKLTGPRWQRVTLPGPAAGGLGPGLAIITGGLGGLGIRAAAVLAAREGLHPVLVDRRDPGDLPPATRHYLRLLAAGPTGVTVRRADLSRPGQAAVLRDLPGKPVVFLHAAGVMCHGPASRYRPDDLAAAQAVKVAALGHALLAIDPRQLRSLVVFGSVLAEQPPHGLGGYGLANEVLRRAVPRLTAGLTGTATVVAQWSIWAGAGMAHDLAVTPQARAMGLTPISLRPGLEVLRRLVGGGVHGPLVLLGAPGDGNAEEGAPPVPAYRRRGWGGVG